MAGQSVLVRAAKRVVLSKGNVRGVTKPQATALRKLYRVAKTEAAAIRECSDTAKRLAEDTSMRAKVEAALERVEASGLSPWAGYAAIEVAARAVVKRPCARK